MSDVTKENVVEKLEENGIDVRATLANIFNKYPELIIRIKHESSVNQKYTDENESNKEQEFHKPDNNKRYDKIDDPNKSCDCEKCINEEKQEDSEEDNCDSTCCLLGSMPNMALMINMLEGLSAINDNILEIANILHKSVPKEIAGAELKTCKMHTGVSKKQLNKLLEKHTDYICDFINERIDIMHSQIINAINGNTGSKKK